MELRRLQPYLHPGRLLQPVEGKRRDRVKVLDTNEYIAPIEDKEAAIEDKDTTVISNETSNIPEEKEEAVVNTEGMDDSSLLQMCKNSPFGWEDARTQFDFLQQHNFVFPDLERVALIQDTFLEGVESLGGREEIAQMKASKEYHLLPGDEIAIQYAKEEGYWRTEKGKIWIPARAEHLKICICVIAHAGLSGHASQATTKGNIKDIFEWKGMEEEITRFCKQCLHCLSTHLGRKIPRPLASTIHGVFPNHVMRLDFVSMPEDEKQSRGFKGLLVMKDDHSQFCWLVPVKEETAEVVANALLDWASKSKMPLFLAVDRGSHFINELIETLRKAVGIVDLIPSVAGNKQTHGGAENLNALVRRIFRTLCSERRWESYEWPILVPLVTHMLNHRRSPLLSGLAPVELFTGQAPDMPLEMAVRGKTAKGRAAELSGKKPYATLAQELTELRVMLNNLHRKAIVSAEKKREETRAQENQSRKEFESFEIGDYVLRGIPDGSSLDKRRNKLQQRWIGPYQVVYPKSKKVYICRDLLTGVLYELHSDYLHRYEKQNYVVSSRVKQQLAFDTMGQKAKAITDFKVIEGVPSVRIKWRGIAEGPDRELWHPISLACNIWTLSQVLQQLSGLKNEEATRYVNEMLLQEENLALAHQQKSNGNVKE